MELDYITRPALGSCVSLGELYDGWVDKFTGLNIFEDTVPNEAISINDDPFTDFQFVTEDTFEEKCAKLKIDGEIKLSVLSNLVDANGSAKFLKEETKSSRTINYSLVYHKRTVYESINYANKYLKDKYSSDIIRNGSAIATHVVQGISWGANVILCCTSKTNDTKNVKDITGNLSAGLKKVAFGLSGKASEEFNDNDSSKMVKYGVRIFGDVLPKGEDLPMDMKEAMTYMRKIPSAMESSNGGKGRPLSYRFIPITQLQIHTNFSLTSEVTLRSIEDTYVNCIIQAFDQITVARQQLHDFYEDANNFQNCISLDELDEINRFYRKMNRISFTSRLAKVLKEVRSGKAEDDKLDNLLDDIDETGLNPIKMTRALDKWRVVKEKIEFASLMESYGAKYIPSNISFEDELVENYNIKCVILYFSHKFKSADVVRWNANKSLFVRQAKNKQTGFKYYAVDCENFFNLVNENQNSCIKIVLSGKVLVEDLLDDEEKTGNMPLARALSETSIKIVHTPNRKMSLTLPCTGNNCDGKTNYEWNCDKCKEKLQYGFDYHVYCDCGKTPFNALAFKCTDPRHGAEYERHDDQYFIDLVESLRPCKELNILLVGPTCVGKSTFRNVMFSFLKNGSLKDETNGSPIQGTQNGTMATETAKIYPINHNGTTIQLIDTPGIGTVAGIEHDKKYIQTIMQTLSELEEIHGICIILNSQDPTGSIRIQYCVQELLMCFHRDAIKNIIFCFTNAKSSFTQEHSISYLRKSMNQVDIPLCSSTTYWFDMAANGKVGSCLKLNEEEGNRFEETFNTSSSEIDRLLKHISKLKPHKVNDSLNLNLARDVVVMVEEAHSKLRMLQTPQRFGDQGDILAVLCVLIGIGSQSFPSILPTTAISRNIVKFALGSGLSINAVNEFFVNLFLPKHKRNETSMTANSFLETLRHSEARYSTSDILENKRYMHEFVKIFKEMARHSTKFAKFLHRFAIFPYNNVCQHYLDYLIEQAENNIKLINNLENNKLTCEAKEQAIITQLKKCNEKECDPATLSEFEWVRGEMKQFHRLCENLVKYMESRQSLEPRNNAIFPRLMNKIEEAKFQNKLTNDKKEVISKLPLNCMGFRESRGTTNNKNSGREIHNKSGLINFGNSCYINSVIQCLRHTSQLDNYLRTQTNLTSQLNRELTHALAVSAQQMRSATICLQHLKYVVDKLTPMFHGNGQHDAHEFLTFMLTKLDVEISRESGSIQDQSVHSGAQHDIGWVDNKSDTSMIQNIFSGRQRSRVVCSKCKSESVKVEPFFILSIDIPNNAESNINIKKCVETYTTEEQILVWQCEKCKKTVCATKKLDIIELPNNLIIHLKRFKNDNDDWTKNTTKITFPLDTVRSDAIFESTPRSHYELYSVINHTGKMDEGHYTALCGENGNWWEFNDSIVNFINTNQICSSDAYVLFYEKQKTYLQQKS